MIDFSKIDSLSIVNEYKRLKLFPKIWRKNSLNELFSWFDMSWINYLTEIKNLWLPAWIINDSQIEDYLFKSVSFSLQSFLKWINYFNWYKTENINFNNCFTQKFLNGYYSHLFLAYSILQFHWINIDLRPNRRNQKIYIKYLDLNNKELLELDSLKTTSQYDEISHSTFWNIFYDKVIIPSRIAWVDKLLFSDFPKYFWWYRNRNKYSTYNESLSRNFHTYYNYTFFNSKNNLIEEKIKTWTTNITKSDYSLLEQVIEFEISYLLWLFSLVCSENDINKNLYKFLNFWYLKKKKEDILYDIEGFQINLWVV